MNAAPAEVTDFPPNRRRFHFDRRLNATLVWVFQGDFYVSANPNEIITTVLGSCIAVCVRDPEIRCGGMNHFLLPDEVSRNGAGATRALCYGSYSIERLTNAIMAHGGRRDRLEIKIFGGASLAGAAVSIGERNADFVERYLKREGLEIAARDLRGSLPRRLRYYPTTGKAMLAQATQTSIARIFSAEQALLSSRLMAMQPGKSEIFGQIRGGKQHVS